MTQGLSYIPNQAISIYDGPNLDAFSRLRISNPYNLFNSHFEYDLNPLLFDTNVSGTGSTLTHDATNRTALMTFSSTPTGGNCWMQSFDYFRYQPAKSQLILLSYNFIAQVANCLKFVGYSDGVNGIEFQNNGTTNQWVIYSSTGNGNQTVTQANWNIDKLDGTGKSGINLSISNTNLAIIDLQALYVGRVRVGYDIQGQIVYCHEFNHANQIALPYIAYASLPVRAGMTCTGTVSTTMRFICASVVSEGGQDMTTAYNFSAGATVTAANNTDTYCFSLRPRTTFNGITNRVKINFLHLDFGVTGANNVFWKLCIGQALTTPTFANVNTTYSTMQIDTAGTLSGSPAIVVDSGFATSNRSATSTSVLTRYPITLDRTGAVRNLGTLSLIVQGQGGNSAVSVQANWQEER